VNAAKVRLRGTLSRSAAHHAQALRHVNARATEQHTCSVSLIYRGGKAVMITRAFRFLGLAGVLMAGTAMAYDGPIYLALTAPLLKIPTSQTLIPRATAIHLSRDKVELRYRFESLAKETATYHLYLPLAPIDAGYAGNEEAFGPDLLADPLGLAATMNGAPLAFTTNPRATFLGLDVTDRLKGASLPLAPFGDGTAAALKSLSKEARADLAERGIVTYGVPNWQVELTYSAKQAFGPGEFADLAMSYRPIFGVHIESLIEMDGKLVYGLDATSIDFLCLTTEQLAEITARFAARTNEEPYRPYKIYSIDMKLENANPQYGWIADMTFTVDMRKPADILASCGGHFVKTAQTRYEWKDGSDEEVPNLKLFFLEAVE
jgi:hypothetical protein